MPFMQFEVLHNNYGKSYIKYIEQKEINKCAETLAFNNVNYAQILNKYCYA